MTLPWPDWSEQEWREAEPKALGGPGSGHHGHTGRKGGGSTSTSTVGIDTSAQPYLVRGQMQYPIDRAYTAPHAVFRGITRDEAESIRDTKQIQSTGAYSHSSEGTSYGTSLAESESVVNVGRDNPALTNRPTFVVQVRRGDDHVVDLRDHVLKSNTPVPSSHIERVWRFDPDGKVTVHPTLDDALIIRTLGGPGSGNFGHAGRPGQVGGSASSPATPYQFHHSLVTSGFHSPTSAADRARVRALRVPPAWTDVQLNPDPEGKLQATGRDVKGRLQYRYSTEHTGEANAEKFERVKEFSQKVPGLRTQIDTDLESDDPEVQETATVLYLIDKTGFRIGTARDTMAEKKAYGASTLESRHIKIDGDKVTFRFTAKKGVQINKTVTDARLARALKIQMSETNKRAPLFDLTNEAGVRQYMAKHAPGFTPKDFRTHFATAAALRAMKGIPFPKTEKAFTLARRKVAKSVSHALGNTPAVALKSYIDPSVFAQWQENTRLRAAAAQSDDALIQEYVETTSYDVPGDWRKRSEDPDE